MNLARKKLEAQIPQDKLIEVKQLINQEYPALFNSLNELSRKKLGLNSTDLSSSVEIYPFYGHNLLYYRDLNPGMEVGGIILEKAHEENFQQFCRKLKEKLDSQIVGLPEWQDLQPVKETFQEIKENNNCNLPTQQEFISARHLMSEATREFLREVRASKRKMLSENAPELEMASELGNAGLLEREYQIFCRDNGLQLMRVDSEAFSDMVKNQFRCTTCGRPFDKERLDLWVSLSKLGKKMVKKHYWLALLIMQQLLEMGIAEEKMVLSCDSQGYTLFLNQDHHLIMLEIKEAAPTAQEIYLFAEKQKFFKVDFAVYFSLLPISQAFIRYLQDSASCNMVIIEGQENFKSIMSKVLEQKRADYIREVFAEIGRDYKLPVASLALWAVFETRPVNGNMVELKSKEKIEESIKISSNEAINIKEEPSLDAASPLQAVRNLTESETVSLAEKEENVVRQLWDNILFKGVGNWPELERMLSEHFAGTPACAALLDNLGLVIVKQIPANQPTDEAEMLAPFGVEAANQLEILLEQQGYAKLELVYLEGEKGYLHAHKVDQNYLILWEQKDYPAIKIDKQGNYNLENLANFAEATKLLLMDKNGVVRQTWPENATDPIFQPIWEIGKLVLSNLGFGSPKKVVVKAQDVFLLELAHQTELVLALFSKTPLEYKKQVKLEKRAASLA